MKSEKRHQTQRSSDQDIDRDLDKMLFLAAEQKLLPKIIYEYSMKSNSPKFANQYRQSVRQIYTKQTAKPLVYNEQDAKTHREKFRQKILKLVNNQLPIDYLKSVKVDSGKHIMTYKGQPLEKVQYPTKPQFTIFNGYSERKFIKQYQDIFEDKLQYTQRQIFKNRKELPARVRTQPNVSIQDRLTAHGPTTPLNQTKLKNFEKTSDQVSLPKIASARIKFDRSKLISPNVNIKKSLKRQKNIDEQALILQTMAKIGKYTNPMVNTISITKESILKYFKQFYSRPHRVVDFLEFSDVQNFTSFSKVPQKLKFMPNEHIYFMTFLFYDTNNDGYICSNDLLRLEQVIKKCPLLRQDLEIIKNGALKIKYQNVLPYQDLYRLSEISETTYFNWLKKKDDGSQNPQLDPHNQQLKGYFEILNKKKILVHYDGFKKLFDSQKPYLWYDLVWRISGVKYEGLKYQ